MLAEILLHKHTTKPSSDRVGHNRTTRHMCRHTLESRRTATPGESGIERYRGGRGKVGGLLS